MLKKFLSLAARKAFKSPLFIGLLCKASSDFQKSLANKLIAKQKASLLPSSYLKSILIVESKYRTDNVCIIGYVPKRSDGWILRYLFDDISRAAQSKCFHFASNPEDVQYLYYGNPNALVLTMHQSFVSEILSLGIPSLDVASFYTHTRLGGCDTSHLANIRAVLPMNSTEAAALVLSGVDRKKIRVFPAGIDKTLFAESPINSISCRSIDVLFSCRYVGDSNLYYHTRKNYKLLRSLAKKLYGRNLRVAILGKGWDECGDHELLSSVEIFDLSHSQFPNIYRNSKLFITVSLQEGGPVSWLEAMASGCLTLSTPSGFPLELKPGSLGSYIMPLAASEDEWLEAIVALLIEAPLIDSSFMDTRMDFLASASFGELARVLRRIAHDPSNFGASLRWPKLLEENRKSTD